MRDHRPAGVAEFAAAMWASVAGAIGSVWFQDFWLCAAMVTSAIICGWLVVRYSGPR